MKDNKHSSPMQPKKAGIFSFLFRCIKTERKLFVATVLLTLLLTGLGLITPKVLTEAIDWIPRLGADKTLKEFLLLLLFGFGLYLLQCTLSAFEDVKSSALFLKIASHMRKAYFKKITSASMTYLDSSRHGDLLSRGTNDLETIVKLLSETLLKIISCTVLFIGCMTIMLCVSWRLALIAICSTVITFFATLFLGGFIRMHASKQQVLLGNINSFIEDNLSVLKSIKLFNREKYVAQRFSSQSAELTKESVSTLSWISAVTPINNLIGNLNFLCIAILGGIMVISGDGTITIATIVLFVLYIREFTETLNDLSEILSETQVAVKAAERYIEVLNAPEEISDETGKTVANGDILLENVHFSYIQGKEVLSGVDLQIKSNQCVAIVGPSGCGKTTLIQLLLRLQDADSGNIRIGGIDIKDISLDELRKNVIAIMQDDIIFDETLSYNISLDANEETAQVADLDWPADNNFHVEHLSRGQMQKICVMRAFSAKAKIIVLDESMSLVDPITFMNLFNRLREIFPSATFVIITHQLSYLRMCDQIFYLSNGQILEQGTFDQLVRQEGTFYTMLKKEE